MAKEEKKSSEKKLNHIDLQETLEEIKKEFGEGAIMRLQEVEAVNVDSISTGSIFLDSALGVGGLPRGRIVEIYGPESSGKSTLAMHCAAEAQKKGGVAAFIDAEHALDPEYSKKLGVKIDELLISQPDSGEQGLQIVESLVRSNQVDIIIIDSVAALTPRKEIAGEIGDLQIGLQARLMSQGLRKLSGIASKSKTIIVFLNQTRMKIGIPFGNPETTPGGMALKFYASVRIRLQRTAQIKQGEDIIGSRIKAKIVKNKVAAPFKTAEFDIYYNEGISNTADIINAGLKYGVIKKSGSWFAYGEEKLGQGMPGTKQALKDNKELMKKIKKDVLDKMKEEESKM
ncbi:MAG: recombinase RecA [Candidatus Parcubacteria bacterium]|nr:recombinase RecA [Candidatus Parcubacteria bacterium]